MKNFLHRILAILLLSIPIASFSQTGPPAPGTGIYALIDTNYNVGTNAQGNSVAKLTYKNNTSTLVTGLQFRVFYDNAAFASSSVALIGSSTNLNLQYVDNPAAGYVTISLVYTGSSATYTIPEGETFELTFTHVAATSFYALTAIQNLTWTGTQTFPQLAAEQSGADTTLTLHNYGGTWLLPQLTYSGSFVNVTGTPAKNLPLALEKKVKIGGSWSQHATYLTDINGDFTFTEPIDTTYYDVRLAIVGDTMSVGNVISTADAQLINQWVLGTATPSGFDFYTGDVNGSNGLTITDAYGVFGRIAGRFSAWPNNVKDVKFFTASEYNTISGTPSTNFTSTIPGVTNFYHDILPGQSTVTFYVAVPGDANGTGYHMARLTPITTTIVPNPGSPLATENVIDMKVEYDFPTENIEVNVPHISVNEGNLVELPVTVKTGNQTVSSLQLALLYDEDLLEFRDLVNSDKTMFWMSAINPTGGIIEWAGYDPSANRDYSLPDNHTAFTLRFIAKQPQSTWTQSPLYTSRKFSGDMSSHDLSITPTNGILVVYKMSSTNTITETEKMIVYPNPTSGEISIDFTVKNSGRVKLYMMDLNGNLLQVILDKDMPAGKYLYNANLSNLSTGLYFATLQNIGAPATSAKILKKQ